MTALEKIAYNTDSQEEGACHAMKVGGGGGVTWNHEGWSGGPGEGNCKQEPLLWFL